MSKKSKSLKVEVFFLLSLIVCQHLSNRGQGLQLPEVIGQKRLVVLLLVQHELLVGKGNVVFAQLLLNSMVLCHCFFQWRVFFNVILGVLAEFKVGDEARLGQLFSALEVSWVEHFDAWLLIQVNLLHKAMVRVYKPLVVLLLLPSTLALLMRSLQALRLLTPHRHPHCLLHCVLCRPWPALRTTLSIQHTLNMVVAKASLGDLLGQMLASQVFHSLQLVQRVILALDNRLGDVSQLKVSFHLKVNALSQGDHVVEVEGHIIRVVSLI